MQSELGSPTEDELDLLGLAAAVDGAYELSSERERTLGARLAARKLVELFVPDSGIGERVRVTHAGSALLASRNTGPGL